RRRGDIVGSIDGRGDAAGKQDGRRVDAGRAVDGTRAATEFDRAGTGIAGIDVVSVAGEVERAGRNIDRRGNARQAAVERRADRRIIGPDALPPGAEVGDRSSSADCQAVAGRAVLVVEQGTWIDLQLRRVAEIDMSAAGTGDGGCAGDFQRPRVEVKTE